LQNDETKLVDVVYAEFEPQIELFGTKTDVSSCIYDFSLFFMLHMFEGEFENHRVSPLVHNWVLEKLP
jgi:hypothetical protein